MRPVTPNLRRSTLAAVALVVLTTTATMAAISWNAPKTIQAYDFTTTLVTGHDADFSGTKVAVAWDFENSSATPPTSVRLRTSTNSGGTFSVIETVETDAMHAEVEICGANVWVVYVHTETGIDVVDLEGRPVAGGSFSHADVSSAGSGAKWPDAACAGGRIFVSWVESGHLMVKHALLSDLVFSLAQDLGPVADSDLSNFDPVLAGVPDHAYIAYEDPTGDIKLHRWSVGPGPSFAVTHETPLGPVDVGNGTGTTGTTHASKPTIAAIGDEVVVAWQKNCDLFARHSANNGATWGGFRKLFDRASCAGAFPTRQFPRSVAIKGAKTIVSHGAFGENDRLAVSTDDLATFTNQNIFTGGTFEHLVGFVTVSGVTKYGAAFDDGSALRYRRQT